LCQNDQDNEVGNDATGLAARWLVYERENPCGDFAKQPFMKEAAGFHFKTYLLIAVIAIFAPLGNVLLGKGMKNVGSAKDWAPSEVLLVLGRISSSGYIWLGIASLLTFFVAYMLVLTWADYSYVQPSSSFAYAVTGVLSYFLLGEAISPLRWLGIAVICVGVFVVGHTPPRTTERV
jgi:uncharacterized membrane protein